MLARSSLAICRLGNVCRAPRKEGEGTGNKGYSLISVSASSNSRSMSARSSYVTGVSSNAAAMAAVVKANFWGIRTHQTDGQWEGG